MGERNFQFLLNVLAENVNVLKLWNPVSVLLYTPERTLVIFLLEIGVEMVSGNPHFLCRRSIMTRNYKTSRLTIYKIFVYDKY